MKFEIEALGISKREAQELISVSKNIKKDYKKLLKGYPIQYLIGYSNFFGYKFEINKNVLIPRYETELLVEKTINYINKYFPNAKNIIDVGTGSGCIAISLKKKFPNINVEGVDISNRALKVARKNNKINKTNVKFYRNDMLSNIKKKYDVIISNPPYLCKDQSVSEQVKKFEPHKALFAKESGLEFYKKIINSKNNIENNSLIAFEIGETQSKLIKDYILKKYPKSKILIEKDFNGKKRFVFVFNNVKL